MKKNIIALLFAFTVINMFGQAPAVSKASKPIDSNTKVLAPNEIVTNKAISPLVKVQLDENSILIYDYDGSLFSFSLDTEDFNWTVKATDAYTEMSANKITLKDGVIYVPFINGEIFAIDNQSGDVFWKSRLGDSKDQTILKDQTLTINGGKLYVTSQNGNIYALNIKDGSLAWSYKLDSLNNDVPILFFDNKVFTQSGTSFYSFDANTGKVLSQKTFDLAMHSKAVTDGENVFIANEKNELFALSPNKFDVLWQFKFDENQFNIKEKIFSKDKKIYFATQGTTASSVYAIDSKTGAQIWKIDFAGDNIDYITENEDTLWGYTHKGKLFQLDLTTGASLFETKLTTLPISNLEFPDDESLFYYCDAGLIQIEIKTKDENVMYMRNTIKDDVYSAYIKIIR
ncbi:PQQ-binding-like beta-propeller repeat protein [Flavobacterium sp. MC2016-06]|jgi:outer membrane protein assembly factor BamB|uniref:outer membrane protein assembly factor BamB family protein n=1 Tax=Flavobacterium sp. MC2016-06 TaxID=2676308 RepID=UPI0012BA9958|nr:PQQ-binding-like beta-propeller repeat protein [Flavobacterium sp. MC2016-06]MBU3861126.1 PQQ-binding-like beta-propeller repeat protein [Flavobacterium sp. MC2016-06]